MEDMATAGRSRTLPATVASPPTSRSAGPLRKAPTKTRVAARLLANTRMSRDDPNNGCTNNGCGGGGSGGGGSGCVEAEE